MNPRPADRRCAPICSALRAIGWQRELYAALGSAVYVLLAAWFVLVLMLLVRKSWLRWTRRLAGWLVLLPAAAIAFDWLGHDWLPGPIFGSGGTLGACLARAVARRTPRLARHSRLRRRRVSGRLSRGRFRCQRLSLPALRRLLRAEFCVGADRCSGIDAACGLAFARRPASVRQPQAVPTEVRRSHPAHRVRGQAASRSSSRNRPESPRFCRSPGSAWRICPKRISTTTSCRR